MFFISLAYTQSGLLQFVGFRENERDQLVKKIQHEVATSNANLMVLSNNWKVYERSMVTVIPLLSLYNPIVTCITKSKRALVVHVL